MMNFGYNKVRPNFYYNYSIIKNEKKALPVTLSLGV